MNKHRVIRDKLNLFQEVEQLRNPIFQLISANQSEDPVVQVLAVAVLARLMSEHIEMDSRELWKRAGNMVNDVNHEDSHHIRAVRDFLISEIK